MAKPRGAFKVALPGRDSDDDVLLDKRESHIWKKHPRSQLYYEMNPRDFLSLTVDGRDILKEIREQWRKGEQWGDDQVLCERIKSEKPIDPPRLIVDRGCRVLGHEGRHRAAIAAAVCKLKRIPVVITCVDADKRLRERIEAVNFRECLQCLRPGKGGRRRFKPQRTWASEWATYDLFMP